MKVAKFCMQLVYIKFGFGMANYTVMGVLRVTWPVFLKFWSNDMFGVGKARHLFRVLTDIEEY